MHASTWLGNRHVVRCPSSEGSHATACEGTMVKPPILCTIAQTTEGGREERGWFVCTSSPPKQGIVLHARRGIAPDCVHVNGGV